MMIKTRYPDNLHLIGAFRLIQLRSILPHFLMKWTGFVNGFLSAALRRSLDLLCAREINFWVTTWSE